MKKIGILTFFKSGNFGGELQAYALQKKLRMLGYDVEVLHQLRPMNKEFILTPSFKPIIQLADKVSKRNRLNNQISKFITILANVLFYRRYNIRRKKFDSFETRQMNLSKKMFTSFDDLYSTKHDYDVFIVGSDQVWNFTNGFSPEPYFLTFVEKNKKKISYAASFGHSQIPVEIQSLYKSWLSALDFISTREIEGEKIVKDLTTKNVTTVLDPTFLLTKEEWKNNISIIDKPRTNYLLIYTLVESPYIFSLARKIAKQKKLKIIRVISKSWTHELYFGVKNIYTAGPEEFVSLFMNATFVLTNSFHGTAFSINFNIPFYTIPRKNKKNNSRITSILKLSNLESRLLYDGDPIPTDFEPSNYFQGVNEILENLRMHSMDFLNKSINTEG
jgi:hypothetical protein